MYICWVTPRAFLIQEFSFWCSWNLSVMPYHLEPGTRHYTFCTYFSFKAAILCNNIIMLVNVIETHAIKWLSQLCVTSGNGNKFAWDHNSVLALR